MCARPVEEPWAPNMLLLERHSWEITSNDGSNIETRIPDVLIIGQKRWGQFFEGVKWVEIV